MSRLRMPAAGRCKAPSLLIAVLMLGASRQLAFAQDEASGPGIIALTGLYGRHAFGIGGEFNLRKRFTVVLRAEGWPYSTLAVAGAGMRVEAVAQPTSFIYVQVLLGQVQCTRFGADAANYSCTDNEWHSGFGASGGLELILSGDYAWSVGVEGGYWFVRDPPATNLNHFSFAALVRYRPPDLRR